MSKRFERSRKIFATLSDADFPSEFINECGDYLDTVDPDREYASMAEYLLRGRDVDHFMMMCRSEFKIPPESYGSILAPSLYLDVANTSGSLEDLDRIIEMMGEAAITCEPTGKRQRDGNLLCHRTSHLSSLPIHLRLKLLSIYGVFLEPTDSIVAHKSVDQEYLAKVFARKYFNVSLQTQTCIDVAERELIEDCCTIEFLLTTEPEKDEMCDRIAQLALSCCSAKRRYVMGPWVDAWVKQLAVHALLIGHDPHEVFEGVRPMLKSLADAFGYNGTYFHRQFCIELASFYPDLMTSIGFEVAESIVALTKENDVLSSKESPRNDVSKRLLKVFRAHDIVENAENNKVLLLSIGQNFELFKDALESKWLQDSGKTLHGMLTSQLDTFMHARDQISASPSLCKALNEEVLRRLGKALAREDQASKSSVKELSEIQLVRYEGYDREIMQYVLDNNLASMEILNQCGIDPSIYNEFKDKLPAAAKLKLASSRLSL
ncbi:hypothetical protein ACYPKM_05195 [Pseudomonas aeruginosa]